MSRPGVTLTLGLTLSLCTGRRGHSHCALHTQGSRLYALALTLTLGLTLTLHWQAWDNVTAHSHSDCHAHWHSHSGALALTLTLHWHSPWDSMCNCTQGSDVRTLASLGAHALIQSCVAGVGQCALPRGLMYALASLGAPPLLRGRRGTMCTAKGSDVRPGVPWGSASFAWQAWDNVHCQGV